MKNLLFTVALSFIGSSLYAQDVPALVKHYITVKDALVSSDGKAAAAAALTLKEGISKDKDFAQKESLLRAVDKIAATSDVEKQRASFDALSRQVWEVAKGAGPLDQDLYYQYCPMKKAYWLSNEAAIKNPYYGSKMLTCGSVKEKKTK